MSSVMILYFLDLTFFNIFSFAFFGVNLTTQYSEYQYNF